MLEPRGLYNHSMQPAECIRNGSIRARAVYKTKFVCRQILHPLYLSGRKMLLSMQIIQWVVVSDNAGVFGIQLRSPFFYINHSS